MFTYWKVAAADQSCIESTGVTKNFDWGKGGKIDKVCDVILVTFLGDVMAITSLKRRLN